MVVGWEVSGLEVLEAPGFHGCGLSTRSECNLKS